MQVLSNQSFLYRTHPMQDGDFDLSLALGKTRYGGGHTAPSFPRYDASSQATFVDDTTRKPIVPPL